MMACLILASCGREAEVSQDGARGSGSANAAASGTASRGTGSTYAASGSACDAPATLCFRDTAFMRLLDTEPGRVTEADWLFFAAARDSLEFYVGTGGRETGGARLSTDFPGNSGYQERDELKNTAPYNRFRMPSDGTVAVWVTASGMIIDTVAYTIRVHRFGTDPTPAFRPTGQRATLTLTSQNKTDRISVVPLGLAGSVRDLSAWTVFPRTYRVALLPDSLYEICRMPCSRRDTVKLTPAANVSKRF